MGLVFCRCPVVQNRTKVRSNDCSSFEQVFDGGEEAEMSAVAHRTEVEHGVSPDVVPVQRVAPLRVVPARRGPVHRPPTRRRVVVGAPRVLARSSCVPRRARLSAVWVLAVASVACAAVFGLGVLSGSVAPSVPSTTETVRVQPGESLWELAGRVAPAFDAAAVVERIRELNGVDGGVQPGQPLVVPVGR